MLTTMILASVFTQSHGAQCTLSRPTCHNSSCRSVATTGFSVMITSRQDDKHHDGVTGDPASNPRSCARITGEVWSTP
jgi:hypothetical protein